MQAANVVGVDVAGADIREQGAADVGGLEVAGADIGAERRGAVDNGIARTDLQLHRHIVGQGGGEFQARIVVAEPMKLMPRDCRH